MLSIKKGAQVKIISGKDKGKTGEVLEINRVLKTGTPRIKKYFKSHDYKINSN